MEREPKKRTEDRCCEEPGCTQPAWPGKRFCAWHPGLAVDSAEPAKQPRRRSSIFEDPWRDASSALERQTRVPLRPVSADPAED